MEKSVIITIMVDDVELKHLDELLESIDQVLDLYEKKRVNVTIQDDTLMPVYPR